MAGKFLPNLSPSTDVLFETDDDRETMLIKDICDSFERRSSWTCRFYESRVQNFIWVPAQRMLLNLCWAVGGDGGFQFGEARPILPPKLAAENVKEDSDCQILEDFTFSDDSSFEGEREFIDIDSEKEEQEKLGFWSGWWS